MTWLRGLICVYLLDIIMRRSNSGLTLFVDHINQFIGLSNPLDSGLPTFSGVLLEERFTQSATDHSLYIKHEGNSFLTLLVYVDDSVITSNNAKFIEDLKTFLDGRFKLKDLG